MNAEGESIKTSSLKRSRIVLRQASSISSKEAEITMASSYRIGFVIRSDLRQAEKTFEEDSCSVLVRRCIDHNGANFVFDRGFILDHFK